MSEVEKVITAASPGKGVVEEPTTSEAVENGNAAHAPASNGHTDHEADDGGESDEYEFEEEQQAVEGEDDEYGDEDEDDDYEEGEGEEVHQNGKSNLTALLLGDHTNSGGGDDEEYDEDADDDDEYEEPDTAPITPITAKKRSIDEALEDAASPKEENDAKKVKA
ncbi:hypothetical protein FA15DRAFT_675084 [Coprinopsis marcescibilis]|uniref:Uncharacterized protein n=1 Tax=Coprinopsis marcescibilis TaxID=230819 RepID=A0A5C3KFF2_COPMA|nr:hypothetical protein FA15DRAFT_675084 [Coprinopsis marcescibilis]